MHRQWVAVLLTGAIGMLASCGSPAAGPSVGAGVAARMELGGYIEDVAGATAVRYGVIDDLGHSMDTVKIITGPEPGGFIGVYHTWREPPGVFDVHLATSTDLLSWTWRVRLATEASQPTIKAASDGGYVLSAEFTPLDGTSDSFPTFRYYPSWDALLTASPTRTYEVGLTLSSCCEGTPNLYAASSKVVDAGFHYLADMIVDRQARATMDWTSWAAVKQPRLDAALTGLGVAGNVGDRDTVRFRGFDFTILEGQLRPDDIRSERLFLVDQLSDVAEQLELRTADGSASVSNGTVELVEIGGHPAIVVAVYVFSDGPQGGPMIYYRTLDGG